MLLFTRHHFDTQQHLNPLSLDRMIFTALYLTYRSIDVVSLEGYILEAMDCMEYGCCLVYIVETPLAETFRLCGRFFSSCVTASSHLT